MIEIVQLCVRERVANTNIVLENVLLVQILTI